MPFTDKANVGDIIISSDFQYLSKIDLEHGDSPVHVGINLKQKLIAPELSKALFVVVYTEQDNTRIAGSTIGWKVVACQLNPEGKFIQDNSRLEKIVFYQNSSLDSNVGRVNVVGKMRQDFIKSE